MLRIAWLILYLLIVMGFCSFAPFHVFGADSADIDFSDNTKWLLMDVSIGIMKVPDNDKTFSCEYGIIYSYRDATNQDPPLVVAELFSLTNPPQPLYRQRQIDQQTWVRAIRGASQWYHSIDQQMATWIYIDTKLPAAQNTELSLINANGQKEVRVVFPSICTLTPVQSDAPISPQQPESSFHQRPTLMPRSFVPHPLKRT